MLIAWSTNSRSTGLRELSTTCTVGLPTPWVTRSWIWATMSEGTITAACAWPLRTLAIASSGELTLTGWIDWNSSLAYLEMLICWLPKPTLPLPGATPL